jgi:hypothetical protein
MMEMTVLVPREPRKKVHKSNKGKAKTQSNYVRRTIPIPYNEVWEIYDNRVIRSVVISLEQWIREQGWKCKWDDVQRTAHHMIDYYRLTGLIPAK